MPPLTEVRPVASEERPRPFRPALVTLTDGVRERVAALEAGFADSAAVLRWTQEMTIRTLGNLDDLVYADLARQFRGEQGVFLAALLVPAARADRYRDLDESVVERVRERFVAEYVLPAHHQAFRELRTDATEYIDEADGGDAHDPRRQSYIAMRPALTELEEWQQRALETLLDGFAERGDILDWAHDVVLATHGELAESFATRAYRERSTARILTGDDPASASARETFAAHHLLPAFRDGVRVLVGRSGELADEDRVDTEAEFA